MEFLGLDGTVPPPVRRRLLTELSLYLAGAFGLTWAIVGLYIWNMETASRLFGPMKLGAPAFYLAVCAPSIAAVAVAALRGGRAGLADLFGSLVRVRAAWWWVAISVLGYPAIWLVVALVRAAGEGSLASFDFTPWLVTLPLLLAAGHFLRDPGALGEELGWRGFALPRLLQLMNARAAAVVLGVVWAVWHLPAFFSSTLSQSSVNFASFVVNVVAFSVLMTWVFVNTRGSVLWAGVVPHILFNATPRAGITPVVWITVLVAAGVLVLGGKHLRGVGRPKMQSGASTMPTESGGGA